MASNPTPQIIDLFDYNYDNFGTRLVGGDRLRGWFNDDLVFDIGLPENMEPTLIGRRVPGYKSIWIAQEDIFFVSSKLMTVSVEKNIISVGKFSIMDLKDGTPSYYPGYTQDGVELNARITKSITVKPGEKLRLQAEVKPKLFFTLEKVDARPQTPVYEEQTQVFEMEPATPTGEEADAIAAAAELSRQEVARLAEEAEELRAKQREEVLSKQREELERKEKIAKKREQELADLVAKQQIIDKEYSDLMARKAILTKQRNDLMAGNEIVKHEFVDLAYDSDEEEENAKRRDKAMQKQLAEEDKQAELKKAAEKAAEEAEEADDTPLKSKNKRKVTQSSDSEDEEVAVKPKTAQPKKAKVTKAKVAKAVKADEEEVVSKKNLLDEVVDRKISNINVSGKKTFKRKAKKDGQMTAATAKALYWFYNPEVRNFLKDEIQKQHVKSGKNPNAKEKTAFSSKVYFNYIKAFWVKNPEIKRKLKAQAAKLNA